MDKGLATRIQNLEGTFSPTERRLVEVLLREPEEVMFESVGAVAARAKAHASALVRLSHKLGYEGFPDLRMALHAGLLQRQSTSDLIRSRLETSPDGNVLNSLITREINALSRLSEFIDQAQIDATATALLKADRIFVLAEGTAEALARHATHRLRRAGLMTVQLHSDPRAVAEAATLLRTGDMVLGFALRETPKLVRQFFLLASDSEAKTALISDLSGMILRPSPDHLLAAPRGRDAESGTLTVPMTILNALILTFAAQGGSKALTHLETYSNTRDDLT